MSPAVNVDLEEVPFAILEAVKARILANRARLGDARKPRPSTRPRPQFRKTGASSKGWRKPQHGAGVFGGAQVGHSIIQAKAQQNTVSGWFFDKMPPYGNQQFAVASKSEQSADVSIAYKALTVDRSLESEDITAIPPLSLPSPGISVTTIQEPPGWTFYTQVKVALTGASWNDVASGITLLLPTGDGNCIAVIRSKYTRTVYSCPNMSTFVYVPYATLPDGSREPDGAAVQFYINKYNAGDFDAVSGLRSGITSASQESDFCFAYSCGGNSIKKVPVPAKMRKATDDLLVNSQGLNSNGTSSGFYNSSLAPVSTWSPQIFKTINDASQFIDLSSTQGFPPGLAPILTDRRKGYYSGGGSDRSLYYAEWTGSPSVVDPSQTQNYADASDATVTLPPDTPVLPDESGASAMLHAVWDWDDPDYCRAMCLALGFTEADLTP